jgi:hypothetical protein
MVVKEGSRSEYLLLDTPFVTLLIPCIPLYTRDGIMYSLMHKECAEHILDVRGR